MKIFQERILWNNPKKENLRKILVKKKSKNLNS